jgi:hypothetical protein
MPKKKGTLYFRRSPDGNVTAEIINHDGQAEVVKDFGKFTGDAYQRLFNIIKRDNPGLDIQDIELMGRSLLSSSPTT